MKADKAKLQLAMARSCMSTARLAEVSGMPRPTLNKVTTGQSVRPETIGIVARTLGIDVTEILADE